MELTLLKKVLLITSIFFLTSCTLKTNLGDFLKSKVDTEVRSKNVQVYSQNEMSLYQSSYLGQVETDFCQNEKFGKLPPKSKLQRTLKARAQKKGGNAIVYGQCKTDQYYKGCDKYLSCEGAVYSLNL